MIGLIVLLLFIGGGGALAWATLIRGGDSVAPPVPLVAQPRGVTSYPVPESPLPLVPAGAWVASASASCVSSPSHDAGGTTVTYGPEKAVDGAADTAWRCEGAGVGHQLEVSFPGQMTLTGVGLVPGYAKTDAYDGTDRYAQNRRISAVRYTFDDGGSVVQNFDTGTYRGLQTIALPNVATSHLTITVLGSVAGEATNGQPPSDKVAISEVAVSRQ
ncbi:MAG: discoidin domain-containing protein [Pseudonocardiaceae bacterium]